MPKNKLFILEDDLVTAAMYDHYFKNDFQVAIASTVDSFYQYFNSNIPDIAIIDINIRNSEYDGEKLVSDLCVKLGELKTKFIAVTGYQELRSSNVFHAHYHKPIDLDQLRLLINSQLIAEDE